jgi:hypothetical protein
MERGPLMTKIITELSKDNGTRSTTKKSVTDILEDELDAVMYDWMTLVDKQEDLMAVPLSYEDRTGHLPKLLRDVIACLRLNAGTKAPLSIAASHHAELRRKQGYSVAMVVEESSLVGFHFYNSAQEYEPPRVQQTASRRGHHRRRG